MNDIKTIPASNATGLAVLDNIESLVTLSQAAKLLPKVGGNHIHTSTLWRWCKKGLRGIYLDYGCRGRTIVTTPDALCRFFAALAQSETTPLPTPVSRRRRLRPRTSDQRRREIEQANSILINAGILKPLAERPSGTLTHSI